MNRRDMFSIGLGAGLVAVTSNLALAQPKAPAPKKPDAKKPPAQPDKGAALLAALQSCLAKAQACNAHCDAQLATGKAGLFLFLLCIVSYRRRRSRPSPRTARVRRV